MILIVLVYLCMQPTGESRISEPGEWGWGSGLGGGGVVGWVGDRNASDCLQ